MGHAVKLLNSEALYESSYTPELMVWVDGTLTGPSAATLSLYDPSGNEIVVDRACTINGSTKKITAIFTGGDGNEIDDLLEDWRLLLKYTISSVAYQANFLFDSVLTPLQNSVTDADLTTLHPEIMGEIWDGVTNFQQQIDQAFTDVKRKLKERGRRPSMLIDAMQLKDLIICHALGLIFYAFAKSTDDIWWNRYLKQEAQFEADFENLHIKYGTDESGSVDETASFGTINFER